MVVVTPGTTEEKTDEEVTAFFGEEYCCRLRASAVAAAVVFGPAMIGGLPWKSSMMTFLPLTVVVMVEWWYRSC